MKEKIKLKINNIKSFIKNLNHEVKLLVSVAFIAALFSSIITYQLIQRKIPKFAVIDLAYLSNDAAISLSRYLVDKKASDEEIASAVKSYLFALEEILKNIQKSGNYILLQKQTVVSENIPDITPEIQKALFESVTASRKNNKTNP